jgi:hypothetical protein
MKSRRSWKQSDSPRVYARDSIPNKRSRIGGEVVKKNTEKNPVPKDIVVVVDECMPSARRIENLNLPRVGEVIGVKGNGWSGLKDWELMPKIKLMANERPEFLFIVLTIEPDFVGDARCAEQGIDLEFGNLRVCVLSKRLFNSDKKELSPGNMDKLTILSLLRKNWPTVLKDVTSNW